MTITIFFDDGGVLNDNEIRGEQWRTYVGQYYSSQFGGDPEFWGEANQKLISSLFDTFWRDPENFWRDKKEKFKDFRNFHIDFKKKMVIGMFKEVGINIPKDINIEEVYNSARNYVIPKVQSAIPGVIESIKQLVARGFILYTAAGPVSIEMKMYLEGMGISQCFKEVYGPDLVNTWKSGPDYYNAIFKHSDVDPPKAIIIDDQPQFLKNALNAGTNVIQACITGQHEPQFPFFVEDMNDLISTIDNLIKSLKI